MTASTDAGATGQNAEKQPELKRVLGWKLLLLFIIGDILGTGVYALTGQVAGEVGGAAWLPFLIAFAVATLTAFSYLELVTKYPQAAGAALYVHKAFGVHFVTFIVLFTVVEIGQAIRLLVRFLVYQLDRIVPFRLSATIVVALLVFLASQRLERLLGIQGQAVLGRLLGVLLAALAVQYVADGILAFTQR